MKESLPIYQPTDFDFNNTELSRWMKKTDLDSLDSLHEAIESNPEWFWREMEKEVDITWLKPYKKVLDTSKGVEWSKWYTDGVMNITIDALDKHAKGLNANKIALFCESDIGEEKRVTYAELYKEVNKFCNSLKAKGVKKGDRVAIYLPMIKESVVALLGIAKIGAISIPCFSGYSEEAIATRLNDSQAKLLITADGYFRRDKKVDMLKVARKAAEKSPSVLEIMIVNKNKSYKKNKSYSNYQEVIYEDCIKNQKAKFKAEPMDSEDPLMLIYTSGTSGKPKGIVHVHGGFSVKAAQDFKHTLDLKKSDILYWVTDMGWIMGPLVVYGTFLLGGSIVIHDGTPDYPKPNRLWEIVEKYGVTLLGLSPTVVRNLMSYDENYLNTNDLTSLRLFASTGEPWNSEAWLWLFEKVGEKRLPIVNHSGGTEIGGGILASMPGLPLKPGCFTGPIPGMVVDIADNEDDYVDKVGKVGELVIKAPWPGMTRGFWNSNEEYIKEYWENWDDVWVHGDWIKKDLDNFWFIEGRSDDTLVVAGKRLGPSEVESVLNAHTNIRESAVIGVPDKVKGESIVAFVVIKKHFTLKEEEYNELIMDLIQLVGDKLGKPFRPDNIYIVEDIPRTKNGKIMRRILKSAYLGNDLGDLSTLENQHIIYEIEQKKIETYQDK